MSKTLRFAPLSVLVLAGIACSLITAPISEAQNLASTAEALATTLPSGMPEVPGMPDVTGFLDPSGTPASEWHGVPIMPEASSGEEFQQNTYSFRVPSATGLDVEEFYDAQLESLGWTSTVRPNVGAAGGYLLFTKGTSVLSILATASEGGLVVLLILQ